MADRLEWWRIALIGLLTLMVATVAYGTLQTNRLVQQNRDEAQAGERVTKEAFDRLQRIENVVAKEFQDHRKRGEAGDQCLVEIMSLVHNDPPDSLASLRAIYNGCLDRVSGGTEPPDGLEPAGGEQ